MSTDTRIADLSAKWLRQDKNERTRAEIQALLDNKSDAELELRLAKRIGFGTAGLRAKMEAGFSRMNDLTVLQASQGLCAYVLEQDPQAHEKGVVIGHDHRHNSARFARLAAGVFVRAGVRTYLLQGLSCTPLVPFSVKRLGAAAGVMVTASHNPAQDNGYKVYWSNAVQIIPPHDAGIAQSIDAHLDIPDEAWSPDDLLASSPLCVDRTEVLQEQYIETVAKLCTDPSSMAQSSLQVVYTPMHGVGLPYVRSVLSAFNFASDKLHVVPSQAEPNPDFPTVKFPNPEEKGALDRAIAHAEEKGVKVVVANDPDADRFCAAEKVGDTWRIFTGDQLGVMLGVHIFRQFAAIGKPTDKLAMLASTVSSKMLAIVAQKEGFTFKETLTGFKWLGNGALELEQQGHQVAFAYEEAIGFMVSPEIRDKDGISALAVFVSLASALANSGDTLSSYLDSLYTTYGHFATLNSYWICPDKSKIARIFGTLRQSSSSKGCPEKLGEWQIASLRDVTEGYDSSEMDKKLRVLPQDRSGEMIQFTVRVAEGQQREGIDGLTGTVRTSGTEPKIKYYLEGRGRDRGQVERALQKVRDAIANEWMMVKKEGLAEPSA